MGPHLKRWVRSALERVDRRFGTALAEALRAGLRVGREVGRGRGRLRWLVAGARLGLGRPARPVSAPIQAGPRKISFAIPDLAGLWVLEEVFADLHYTPNRTQAPQVILDLGANIGASAVHYRREYPQARIVCLEPDPQLCRLLRRNVAGLDVEVVHGAIADTAGSVDYFASDESWAGTTVGGNGPGVRVPAFTLDQLISEYQPALVKLDIEGAEYNAIGTSSTLDRVTEVTGEIHSPVDDPRTIRVMEALSAFEVDAQECGGFTLFHAHKDAVARLEE